MGCSAHTSPKSLLSKILLKTTPNSIPQFTYRIFPTFVTSSKAFLKHVFHEDLRTYLVGHFLFGYKIIDSKICVAISTFFHFCVILPLAFHEINFSFSHQKYLPTIACIIIVAQRFKPLVNIYNGCRKSKLANTKTF